MIRTEVLNMSHWVMATANVVIALAYVGNGLYIAPRFHFGPGVATGARIARLAGTAFFLLCAITHFRIAYLTLDGGRHLMDTPFDLIVHIAQGIAGWVFLATAMVFLDFHIRAREEGVA